MLVTLLFIAFGLTPKLAGSPNQGWNPAPPSSGNVESIPLDCQGILKSLNFEVKLNRYNYWLGH